MFAHFAVMAAVVVVDEAADDHPDDQLHPCYPG